MGSAPAALAQTIVWDGGGDQTSWTSVNNWNPNRLPNASDDVLIPTGARTVAFRTGTHTVRSLTTNRSMTFSGGTLTISGAMTQAAGTTLTQTAGSLLWGSAAMAGTVNLNGGTVTVNGASTFSGVLSLESTTITGPGDILVSGAGSWGQGEVRGEGLLTVPAGVVLDVYGSGGWRLLSRPMLIAGTVRMGPGSAIEPVAPVLVTVPEGGLIENLTDGWQSGISPRVEGEGSRLILDGTIASLGSTGMEFSIPIDCGPTSHLIGGTYTRMGRAAGLFEAPPGRDLNIVGSSQTPPAYEEGARLVCPETGRMWVYIGQPFPEGFLDQARGSISLFNVSTQHTLEFPPAFAPRDLRLDGVPSSSFRVSGDLSVPIFSSTFNTRVELIGTLTITDRYDGTGMLAGPGRLVLSPGLVVTECLGHFDVLVENHASFACGQTRFSLYPSGVFINEAGATITLRDAPFYTGRRDYGLFINRGDVTLAAYSTFTVIVYANTVNEPGAVLRAVGNVAVSIPRLLGAQHGEWRFESITGPFIAETSAALGPASFAADCTLRCGAGLSIGGGEVAIEEGCRVTVGPLSVLRNATLFTLREPVAFTSIRVDSPMDIQTDLTLPPTTITGNGVLRGAGRLTVGSTMTVDGALEGPGELLVPAGAQLAFIGPTVNPPVRSVSRPITNAGTIRLCSITVRLADVALTIAPTGMLRHGSENILTAAIEATGSGRLVNEGTVLCDAAGGLIFRAPLDNRGAFICREALPLLTSTPQLQGTTLVGGSWTVGGRYGPQWPAGTTIDTIGPGAVVTLEAGTGLPIAGFDRSLRRIEGSLVLTQGRDLALSPPTPGRLTNAGGLSLSGGSGLGVVGDFQQTDQGRLICAYDGPAADQRGVLSASSALLGGTLRIAASTIPPCGSSFPVLTAPNTVNTLSAVEGTGLPEGRRWRTQTDEVAVRAGVFTAADFNADAFVDFFDYLEYAACFTDGACPPAGTADFNLDGFADFFDYADFVGAFESGGGC